MNDFRETLVGLFTEVAIIEHLLRTRMEQTYPDGLGAGHFGILNYFARSQRGPDSIAGIAWSFQEELEHMISKVATLESFGLLALTPPNGRNGDTMVDLTEAGVTARNAALDRMGPDIIDLVAEIDPDQINIAYQVLQDIRLTMDNLPDR
jgi:hypothetical protein